MTHNNGQPWTPEDDRVLMAMRAKGYGLPEIAKRVGRTQTAVQVHISLLTEAMREAAKAPVVVQFGPTTKTVSPGPKPLPPSVIKVPTPEQRMGRR